MAFDTNCLGRRKVLFLLFADLGYNQGNKQEQYALRKTERLEIIMTKEQITGTLAMWRRVKKDEETFKESRNLGTITSMKGFVTRRNWGWESHCVVVVYYCNFYQTFRYRMSQVPSARENEWLGQIEHYKIYKTVFSQRNIFLDLTSISGICKKAKAKAFHMRRLFPFPKMLFPLSQCTIG